MRLVSGGKQARGGAGETSPRGRRKVDRYALLGADWRAVVLSERFVQDPGTVLIDGEHARAAELARRRANAGFSLADLAARAHVHRGYVHRMERGERWPSVTVVRAVDAALAADGALLALWEAADIAAADLDDFERFERALAAPQRTDAAVVEHLARVLAEQRRAEDALGARRLLPPVLAQLTVIDRLLADTRGPVRRELLAVGAHYEQFAGWMSQDAMDLAGARCHYDQAMQAAQEVGDVDMVTSVLSLNSHLA